MNDFSKVVDSLENRIQEILKKQEDLHQSNIRLESKIDDLKRKNSEYRKKISDSKEENHALRLANSLLGSDQFKRETKLKINALIREIDLCITQLSV